MSEEPPTSPLSPPPAGNSASEEALFAALVKADRSEALGPLVAGMARELNELTTKILGVISLAGAGALQKPVDAPSSRVSLLQANNEKFKEDDLTEAFADAEKACLAARELAGRMATLSRLGGADGAIALAPRDILADASKVAGAGSGVEIEIAVAEGVDRVRADRGQIAQAFQNLVLNAVESMHPPPQRPRVQLRAANATLEAGRIAGLPAGDYVEFEVRDNGCGIEPANLEKIWEPFFTTKKHGSGLGLPSAVAIVRRHGGEIGVDSSLREGTVFTVFLPALVAASEVRAHAAPSQRFRSGRVLIMDDDDRIRSLTELMLRKLNYKADNARDGEDAVAQYRRYLDIGRPYDAVILDMAVTGGMGGEEAFKLLRELDPDVRAIAASGSHPDEISAHCLEMGFCGCLAKPYAIADLGKVLGTVLG